MAEYRWTENQKAALSARSCDLAVSAAAGSGKTAVLTQRIVSLIAEESGIRADRLAVVTFTKAAAAELEERLYQALSERVAQEPENKHLARQLFRLSSAHISTIHSFCFSLIRTHRKALGLRDRLRIADPIESTMLCRAAAEEAIEEFLAEADPEERKEREALFRLFGKTASDAGVVEALLFLLKKSSTIPGGLWEIIEKNRAWAKEAMGVESGALSFEKAEHGATFCREARLVFRQFLGKIDALLESLNGFPTLSYYYADYFSLRREALIQADRQLELGLLRSAAEEILPLLKKNLISVRSCPEEEREQKDLICACYREWKTELIRFCENELFRDPEALRQEAQEEREALERLLSLAEKADRLYRKKKDDRDVLDYGDLEQYALRLVAEKKDGSWKKTALAEKIQEEFDAFFVDEYQDTNQIQDLIFRFLGSGKNLFLVGDPKQSIYRFRGAEPSIFSQYKSRLPAYPSKEGSMQKIFLSHNFRCDAPIIQVTNRIFRVLMDETAPDSLYTQEDWLRCGKENSGNLPVELVLLEKPRPDPEAEEEKEANEEEQQENREAAYIAGRIGNILSGKEAISVSPEEIAVICRTSSQAATVSDALRQRGIPSSLSKDNLLREEKEYLFVTSLLQALDNPCQDIPLLATLSSPAFSFSDDALYAIRQADRKGSFYAALCRYARENKNETALRCREAIETMKQLREEAKGRTLSSLLFYVYRVFSPDVIFSKNGVCSPIRSFFLEKAQRAQNSGFGYLSAFLRYLEEEGEEEAEGEQSGVRLMTIHKSKGLEFPVVFVSFLAKRFHTDDGKEPLSLSSTYGLTSAIPRLQGRAKFVTLRRRGIALALAREDREEEKRILYVALTRAREKLILTGTPSSLSKLRRDSLSFCQVPLSPSTQAALLDRAGSHLTMLLLALKEEETVKKALESGEDQWSEDFAVRFASAPPMEAYRAPEEAKEALFSMEELEEWLNFQYESKYIEDLPKKLSVSELIQRDKDREDPEFYPRKLLDFQEGKLLTDAARIGTATHQVMQFIDFAGAKDRLEEELQRLLDRQFLSPEDMALVDREALKTFFQSSLYEEIVRSPRVEHEKRFNVLLPAEALLNRPGEVLVQGVIDAWFENPDGSLTLVDFKTDRVRGEEGEKILRQRHGEQLRLYRLAVEKITGKAVTHLILYSFSLGKSVTVSL